MEIKQTIAREILDSRGNPTVEVEVALGGDVRGRAAVPSGASTGKHEALELRDGGPRFGGKGVRQAVENVNKVIAPAVSGVSADQQEQIDRKLIELDGTDNKRRLGANAILATSLAVARATARGHEIPLFEYIMRLHDAKPILPVPLMNVLNGGAHADNGLEIQEFMIVPVGATTFADALRMGAEVFHALKRILSRRELSTAVGDEGGFAPKLRNNEQALKLLVEAIDSASYIPGKDVALALDAAASGFCQEGAYVIEGKRLGSVDLTERYQRWARDYPLVSIEDGLSEDDWQGWRAMTLALGPRLQLVGDDLFVTQETRLNRGIEQGVANAILIKPNQIGTLTETLCTMRRAQEANYRTIVSHRSGETEDTFIADLAVGTGCGQIKTGSLSRGERTCKYNRLLRLEERFQLPLARAFTTT